MNQSKFLNIREVSKFLTGKPDKIRYNRTPEEHKEAIQELNNFLEFWQNKYKK